MKEPDFEGVASVDFQETKRYTGENSKVVFLRYR